MPTGYTAAVADGSITTLKEFAFKCARGMVTKAPIRDEPLSAPLPEKLEPSDHYKNRIAETEAQLATLAKMQSGQIENNARFARAQQQTDRDTVIANMAAQRDRYNDMIEQVSAWEGAPEGLKEFMLEQLRGSLNFDCGFSDPILPPEVTPEEWHAAEVTRLTKDLEYYTRMHVEEVKRTDARNEWLAQLHKAVS